MSLTINLPTTIEQQFRQEAALNGLSLDTYLVRLLQNAAKRAQKHKPLSESELLEKINLNISEAEWITYRHLISLRRAELLTEDEHQALIELGDKIEVENAKRVKYLFELAKMRGISVEKLMTNLGIAPIEV